MFRLFVFCQFKFQILFKPNTLPELKDDIIGWIDLTEFKRISDFLNKQIQTNANELDVPLSRNVGLTSNVQTNSQENKIKLELRETNLTPSKNEFEIKLMILTEPLEHEH